MMRVVLIIVFFALVSVGYAQHALFTQGGCAVKSQAQCEATYGHLKGRCHRVASACWSFELRK